MAYSIDAYKHDGKWFGAIIWGGIKPVLDSTIEGEEGAFSTKEEALRWARNEKARHIKQDKMY